MDLLFRAAEANIQRDELLLMIESRPTQGRLSERRKFFDSLELAVRSLLSEVIVACLKEGLRRPDEASWSDAFPKRYDLCPREEQIRGRLEALGRNLAAINRTEGFDRLGLMAPAISAVAARLAQDSFRGEPTGLAALKKRQVNEALHDGLTAGKSVENIAADLGQPRSTVYRHRRKISSFEP